MRMTALETTVAGINAGGNVDPATVTQLQTDLTALTAKNTALCAKVTEVTMVAGADPAVAFDVALEAIADPAC